MCVLVKKTLAFYQVNAVHSILGHFKKFEVYVRQLDPFVRWPYWIGVCTDNKNQSSLSVLSKSENAFCMVGLFLVNFLIDKSSALLLASLRLFSDESRDSFVLRR